MSADPRRAHEQQVEVDADDFFGEPDGYRLRLFRRCDAGIVGRRVCELIFIVGCTRGARRASPSAACAGRTGESASGAASSGTDGSGFSWGARRTRRTA